MPLPCKPLPLMQPLMEALPHSSLLSLLHPRHPCWKGDRLTAMMMAVLLGTPLMEAALMEAALSPVQALMQHPPGPPPVHLGPPL